MSKKEFFNFYLQIYFLVTNIQQMVFIVKCVIYIANVIKTVEDNFFIYNLNFGKNSEKGKIDNFFSIYNNFFIIKIYFENVIQDFIEIKMYTK